jgi:histidine triad (HIT) family protein
MSDCIFCRIVRGEIPCSKVLETDKILAFNDIHPVAPVHVLIIPKEHIATFNDVKEDRKDILEEMYRAAQKIAREKGIADKGYRVAVNVNPDGGQIIFHLHMHVFGGRKLTDAMG